MTIVMYSLFVLLGLYGLLTLWLTLGFLRTKSVKATGTFEDIAVSIIICARNEEKKIALCLNTLKKQDYDHKKIQVLLINDASTDDTVRLAEAILKQSKLEYTIISNPVQKGKKHSIAYAMQFARHPLIITRDADTFTLSDKWLKGISEHYQANPSDMIIGPVALADNFGILWALQAIENNILTLLSAGSAFYKHPFLCSGANLIFTKKAFEETGAYASHIHVMSGDDILFMEDLKKREGAVITYLKNKDAVVYTYPCYSLRSLLSQKIRWAAKFKVNGNKLNLLIALLGFLVNLGWLFCLLYGFIKPLNNSHTLVFILLKLFIDFLLLFLASGFIKNKGLLWFSLPVGFVYPLYACLVAVSTLIIKPKWKP